MRLEPTPITGVFEAFSMPRVDERGSFARLFCEIELAQAHAGRRIEQINHSFTRDVGAIRGMHYQIAPAAEAKWVRCLSGRVFDVVVDLRRGSPTFLRWHAIELDAARMNAIFIPEGCAHGFQVLACDSHLLYLHTAAFRPELQRAVRWNDPRLNIEWPLPATVISDRDRNHPDLEPNFQGLAP